MQKSHTIAREIITIDTKVEHLPLKSNGSVFSGIRTVGC